MMETVTLSTGPFGVVNRNGRRYDYKHMLDCINTPLINAFLETLYPCHSNIFHFRLLAPLISTERGIENIRDYMLWRISPSIITHKMHSDILTINLKKYKFVYDESYFSGKYENVAEFDINEVYESFLYKTYDHLYKIYLIDEVNQIYFISSKNTLKYYLDFRKLKEVKEYDIKSMPKCNSNKRRRLVQKQFGADI